MADAIQSLQDDITAFLRRHHLNVDTHFYNQEQWRQRGETVGLNAMLTLTAEGVFYRLMNVADLPGDAELIREFNRILARRGYWYEQGFAWSFHFYPEAKPMPPTSNREIVYEPSKLEG